MKHVVSVTDAGAAVIVPLDATAGTMSLTATEHATGAVRTLPPMQLRATELSAHLFPSYGPQTDTITWGIPDATTPGLEVAPGSEGDAELQTFAFNAAPYADPGKPLLL